MFTPTLWKWISGVLLFVAGAISLGRYAQENTPFYTTGTDTASPLIAGDSEAAMRQSQELLVELRRANWDPIKVPRNLLLLPDRTLNEVTSNRSDRVTSFGFPSAPRATYKDVYAEVAFYSNLYVRRNISRYNTANGPRTASRPDGFFIVAFKNGDIVKVKPEDARLYTAADGSKLEIYKGMDEWREDLPLLPWVQNAAPPDSPILVKIGKATPTPAAKQPTAPGACADPKP